MVVRRGCRHTRLRIRREELIVGAVPSAEADSSQDGLDLNRGDTRKGGNDESGRLVIGTGAVTIVMADARLMAQSLGRERWSDAALLAGIADGDEASFSTPVWSPEPAAGMTAETFSAALGLLAGYREDRDEVRAWLFGIARQC